VKIIDYQTGRELRDVSVVLTDQELDDLAVYVDRLRGDHRLTCTYLTEVCGDHLSRELSVAVEGRMAV
jgi:hypothetical protein